MSTNPGDMPEQPIKGHKYDGIQEYDNPMPGWWVWLFWGSAVFALVYVLGIEVFDFVNTYEDDLAEGVENLEAIRTAYAEANPSFTVDDATIAQYVQDPAKVEAGAVSYAAQCANCHGNEGQGLIGPNMTDAYWVHGGSNTDIYNLISKGSVTKGMPPWEGVYSPEQRAELVAFIQSIQGTDPPNPKGPEGDLYEGG